MNALTLSVDGSPRDGLEFVLSQDGKQLAKSHQSPIPDFEDLPVEPIALGHLVPTGISRAVNQWVLEDPAPGIVALQSSNEKLDGLPWELLPRLFDVPSVFVVRLTETARVQPAREPNASPTLLAAGWSGRPQLHLPGIQQELAALSRLDKTAGVKVRVLYDPDLDEVARTCAEVRPGVLHLIPPGVSNGPMPELQLSIGEELQLVRLDDFLALLLGDSVPQLVVLNSCWSGEGKGGPSATRVVTQTLGAVSVGWLGEVEDLAAADFTQFFYSRLLEGKGVASALQAYRSLQLSKTERERPTRDLGPWMPARDVERTLPVLWTPSLHALLEAPFGRPKEAPARDGDRRSRRRGTPREVEKPLRIQVNEFTPQPWLNPAQLRNKQPPISRLVLEADGPLPHVCLALTCDTGSGTSTIRQTQDLERGPQPIATERLQFPVLYELIESDVPRRQINFTLTCSVKGEVLAERTDSVLWMGLAEWLDQPESWRFIPAFVDPFANGVLDVIDEADRLLKRMVSPRSSFSGYQIRGTGVHRQAEALFNCLRDDPFHLSYINPPPVGVFTPGARYASGQRVRTPDEIISRHRGTCHDLALLMASCLEHVGIFPLVILIRGHTFGGYWNSEEAHSEFWERAGNQATRQQQDPGRRWTMTELSELSQLLDEESVTLLETTRVTDRNADFQDAIQSGAANLERCGPKGEAFDVAVDIQSSRERVQPI